MAKDCRGDWYVEIWARFTKARPVTSSTFYMNIIAYGSLMNKKSLEKTLKRKIQLSKVILTGYERIFNAPFGEYAFLNLQKNKNNSIEVAYFIIKENELKKFAKREEGSELIEVTDNYFAFIWPSNKCKELPVLQSYLDVCEKGAEELEINIWKGAIMPFKIINDKSNPFY
jgi:hypothetical protein